MNILAPASPIVREIVLRVIKRIEINNLKRDRHAINTNLIPKFSEKTKSSNSLFEESMIHSQQMFFPPILPKLKEEPVIEIKIEEPKLSQPTINLQNNFPEELPIPTVQNSQPTQANYGKMLSLLNDRSLSHIECFGPNIPLNVIKMGQKQRTNILLTEEEIKSFLAYVSEKAKIPLIDGVFNVLVDGILVNAIVSDTIGTKFMIKKNYQIQQ